MSITMTISDSRLLQGVEAAKDAYNESAPTVEGGPPFVPFATAEEYMQFVVTRAAESYCNQYEIP